MGGTRAARVLVVDDHEPNLKLLRLVLEVAGYEVTTVSSLAAAERVIEASAPALIVLDRQLPDGDGLELALELKRRPASPPILACTAGEPNGEWELPVDAPWDACVAKPIDVDGFVEVVGTLLAKG